MLAGCGEPEDPVSSRTIPSISEDTSDKEINSIDNPYSVAQFLDYCNKNVEKVNNSFSDGYFHVKALAKEVAYYNTSSSVFFKITLVDAIDSEDNIPTFKIVKGDGINQNIIYQGDEVLIKGYGEYYDGRYTIYPNDTVDVSPTLLSYTNKTSEVTLEDGNHVSYDVEQLAKSYANGSKVTFKPTADDGYVVKYVLVNGVDTTPDSDGNYSFTVNGPTKVLVRDVPDSLVEEGLPAGDYSITLTKSIMPLAINYGSYEALAKTAYFQIEGKEDSFDKLYKKLKIDFSEGCINSYDYDEFGYLKGKSMLFSVVQENMKISSIDIEYFSSCTSFVYNAIDDSDENKEVEASPIDSKYSNGAAYSYAIDGKNVFLRNDPDGTYSTNMFFYITLKLVVA